MFRPSLGKSGLRDFLYYLFNRGESPEPGYSEQTATQASTYEIGLIAATQQEADQVLARISRIMREHQPNLTRHRFTAYGLDQAWQPQQIFAEVHWIQSRPDIPLPQERLTDLGNVVHIHLLKGTNTRLQPGLRTYRWKSVSDLTEFLASLYLSQESCGFLALNWESYCRWQPEAGCIITVDSGWGPTPKAAIQALVQSAATNPSGSSTQILIIEAGSEARIGDYTDIVGALERRFGYDFVTSLWVSRNYSGFGLKLARCLYP